MTDIEELENITPELSKGLPAVSSGKSISYAQAVDYLTYKINECVDIINRLDPEVYTKDIDAIKANIEAIETELDGAEVDINALTTKVDTLLDSLNATASPATVALRTDGGQLVGAEAATDEQLPTFGQVKTYVSEHGGAGLSLHKTYTNIKNQTYTIDDADVYTALKTNDGVDCLLMVNGLAAYSAGSAPFSFVIYPIFNSYTYNQKQIFEVPFTTDIGETLNAIKLTLNYDTVNSITVTTNSANARIYRIEVIKF